MKSPLTPEEIVLTIIAATKAKPKIEEFCRKHAKTIDEHNLMLKDLSELCSDVSATILTITTREKGGELDIMMKKMVDNLSSFL